MTAAAWLAILGIGEDGVEALSPAARTLLGGAALVVGGARHLALAALPPSVEILRWPSPMADGIPAILARRGEAVAVLASGDPFCFGVGSLLAGMWPRARCCACRPPRPSRSPAPGSAGRCRRPA